MTARIGFANDLRGVAAACVVASHYVGVYWAMPDVVSAVSFSPPQGGALPALFGLISHQWFQLGPFGVALFFLISGLVVPFSLENHTRLSFLGARALRIYPTYIAALLLGVGLQYASATVWERPFTTSWTAFLSNCLLMYDFAGQPSLDLVNWTLSVEIKFYLLVAVLAPAIRAGRVWPLLAVAGAILVMNGLLTSDGVGDPAALPSSAVYTLSSHSLCILYMLIGVSFHFHFRNRISTPELAGLVLLLGVLFTVTWRLSVWHAQFPVVIANYGYAAVLFCCLYGVRHLIPALAPLRALAAISFPFYVLHPLLGYVLLRFLMVRLAVSYNAALTLTVVSVVLVAWVFHRLIEQPTARYGRTLGRFGKGHELVSAMP